MNINPIWRALAAFVFFTFALPLSNAQDAPDQSLRSGVAEARALIDRGRFDEALAVLRPLAEDHPDGTNIHFLVGLAAIEASRRPGVPEDERVALLDEAVAALRSILIDRPDLVRVRLELARAFFLKEEDGLARDHFERVLAGEPPLAITANIRRFLNVMRARRRWSARFGFTFAPDSNIGSTSEEETVYIGGFPFRRDGDTTASSGVGVVIWGGGEYQHPLNERLRIRTGADVSRREYSGKDFDETFLSGHAGPHWLAGKATEFSLLGSARRRWIADEPHSSELGVRFEVGHRFASWLRMSGRASWHQREHRRTTYLDGPVAAFFLDVNAVITPTLRIDATIGYSRQRTESVVRRNTGRWVRLGASVALPRGFTLGAAAELRRTDYEGIWCCPNTLDGGSREDRVRILSASVYNRAFTLYGFSPQFALVNEERESTAQLYDYKRNRAELRFVRQF